MWSWNHPSQSIWNLKYFNWLCCSPVTSNCKDKIYNITILSVSIINNNFKFYFKKEHYKYDLQLKIYSPKKMFQVLETFAVTYYFLRHHFSLMNIMLTVTYLCYFRSFCLIHNDNAEAQPEKDTEKKKTNI